MKIKDIRDVIKTAYEYGRLARAYEYTMPLTKDSGKLLAEKHQKDLEELYKMVEDEDQEYTIGKDTRRPNEVFLNGWFTAKSLKTQIDSLEEEPKPKRYRLKVTMGIWHKGEIIHKHDEGYWCFEDDSSLPLWFGRLADAFYQDPEFFEEVNY